MCIYGLLVFDRGSLGPSTVTLIALLYDATCGGLVETVIVNVKLLPVNKWKLLFSLSFRLLNNGKIICYAVKIVCFVYL